jgi:N-acetylglutamate synthase-like GNAT family acetyltransferase
LEILVVHPDYQGVGIGKKLIQTGLDDAAALALDKAYLEASEAGYPLYKKFGWQDVDQVFVDLEKYGGKGVWPTICMRRGN